jgi:hypothetical protein
VDDKETILKKFAEEQVRKAKHISSVVSSGSKMSKDDMTAAGHIAAIRPKERQLPQINSSDHGSHQFSSAPSATELEAFVSQQVLKEKGLSGAVSPHSASS